MLPYPNPGRFAIRSGSLRRNSFTSVSRMPIGRAVEAEPAIRQLDFLQIVAGASKRPGRPAGWSPSLAFPSGLATVTSGSCGPPAIAAIQIKREGNPTCKALAAHDHCARKRVREKNWFGRAGARRIGPPALRGIWNGKPATMPAATSLPQADLSATVDSANRKHNLGLASGLKGRQVMR